MDFGSARAAVKPRILHLSGVISALGFAHLLDQNCRCLNVFDRARLGAYGAVQAGTYNTRLLVPEVLVDGDRFHVVRQRQSYDELIGLDSVPDWLA